jgi:hypothetical protein
LRNTLSLDPSSFIFGASGSPINLHDAYPSSMYAFTLWQAFLQNVNPLSKLIYAPTVQDQVIDASRDLNEIPRPSISLLFAIYAAAVMSWKEDECLKKMGEPKSTLLKRYLSATRQALIDVGFIQSANLVVLQAFTIFLVSRAP